jgi:hypothetical protein
LGSLPSEGSVLGASTIAGCEDEGASGGVMNISPRGGESTSYPTPTPHCTTQTTWRTQYRDT